MTGLAKSKSCSPFLVIDVSVHGLFFSIKFDHIVSHVLHLNSPGVTLGFNILTILQYRKICYNYLALVTYFQDLAELSLILAHLSQYFPTNIAPSVLYLTNFVAASPHLMQNLDFIRLLDVKGSILFIVRSDNYIVTNYIGRINIINQKKKFRISLAVTIPDLPSFYRIIIRLILCSGAEYILCCVPGFIRDLESIMRCISF